MNGIFAFALYDGRENTGDPRMQPEDIFIARDGLGTTRIRNQISAARPVEKSDSGAQAQAKDAKDNKGSEKFLFDDRHMVFEKYDKNGQVILRIPPSEKPVDQVA